MKEETDDIESKKDVKRYTDPLSGFKYEVDFKNKNVTNITYPPEEIVKIKKIISHPYKYTFIGELVTMNGEQLTIFEIEDTKTGQRRFTIKDELTGRTFPISAPNSVELLRMLSGFVSKRKDIKVPDKYKWLIRVFSERYATDLLKMILESKEYGITAKEFMEGLQFPNAQKARNVLYKFKRLKFLSSQRMVTKEVFYTPSIKREELEDFIRIYFGFKDN